LREGEQKRKEKGKRDTRREGKIRDDDMAEEA
jgi:hypothetical protein